MFHVKRVFGVSQAAAIRSEARAMRFNAGLLIRDWMKAKGLTEAELTAYAVVYSATKGPKVKTVTSQYVAGWLRCDEVSARRVLNRLAAYGLIDQLRIVDFSGTTNIYAARKSG